MDTDEALRVLGLGPGPSGEEVKAAYRRIVLSAHPDMGGTEAEFKRATEAYELLSGPRPRRGRPRSGPFEPPGDAMQCIRTGRRLARSGRHAEAVSCFEKAARLDPYSAEARRCNAAALAGLGRHAEAVRWCEMALRLDPGNPEAYRVMAGALESLGRGGEALKCRIRMAELNPRDAQACCTLAERLSGAGRHAEAVRWCDAAIAADPSLEGPYLAKARALEGQRRYGEAIACHEDLAAAVPGAGGRHAGEVDRLRGLAGAGSRRPRGGPRAANEHHARAAILVRLGRYGEALDLCDEAMSADPRAAGPHRTKAEALEGLGLYREALECYGRALKLDPHDRDALRGRDRVAGHARPGAHGRRRRVPRPARRRPFPKRALLLAAACAAASWAVYLGILLVR